MPPCNVLLDQSPSGNLPGVETRTLCILLFILSFLLSLIPFRGRVAHIHWGISGKQKTTG